MQSQDVCPYLFCGADRLGPVEVASEADLVPDSLPCRLGTRHRAAWGKTSRRRKDSMPPSSVSGICSASRKATSGSYSTTTERPEINRSKRPRSGTGMVPSLVDLPNHRRRIKVGAVLLLQRPDFSWLVGSVGVDSFDAKGSCSPSLLLYPKSALSKDLALFGLLEGQEGFTDAGNVLLRQFAILLSQVLSEWMKPAGAVYQLVPCRGGARACDW